MNKNHVLALVLLCSALLCSAQKKDGGSPAENYEQEVATGQLLCKVKVDLAIYKGDLTNPTDGQRDWRGCIKEYKTKIKTAYDAFAKTVKKPAAKAALKEHYVLAISSIVGLEPEYEEIVISYRRRQAEINTRVNEQWTRFEAEN